MGSLQAAGSVVTLVQEVGVEIDTGVRLPQDRDKGVRWGPFVVEVGVRLSRMWPPEGGPERWDIYPDVTACSEPRWSLAPCGARVWR